MDFSRTVKGRGKTITISKIARELVKQYPEINIISNVKIKGLEKAKMFKNSEELVELLKQINIEEDKGYLIIIDEIHVVLAELYGKTDPIFLQFLSQQRKLKIHILASSQMFNYIPKFCREYLLQSGQIIMCSKLFKIIQINKYVEMDTIIKNKDLTFTYQKAKIKWWIHSKEDYESYDTFAVISQIQGLMKGSLNYGDRLPNYNGQSSET